MFALPARAFAFTASALIVATMATVTSAAHAADAAAQTKADAATPTRADSTAQTKLIRYSDLDLTTDTGEAVLKQRIAHAAAAICGPADGRTLEDRSRLNACRDNAIASASPQMNAVIASVRSSDHRYAMNNDAIAMLGR